MQKYVVFPTYGNVNFAEVIEKRGRELGYVGESSNKMVSVTLCAINGRISWTAYPEEKGDHEIGDLKRLFITEDYRFNKKPKIVIGEYEVNFKEDGIKVGCQFINKETILKIAEEFKDED